MSVFILTYFSYLDEGNLQIEGVYSTLRRANNAAEDLMLANDQVYETCVMEADVDA